MNRAQAARAIDELAASTASEWIGNRIVGNTWVHKCTRCGTEETIELPPDIREPADVPDGLDEKLFDWMRSFQRLHEGCVGPPPATDAHAARQRPAPPPPAAPAAEITMRRILQCARHGERRWQGHVMCDACGRTYQTADERKSGYPPEVCRCGQRLLPPASERIGDVLGLQTGGVVIDEEGRRYQTPEAENWTARSICYLCYRYFAKHHGGRVPVERERS